MVSILGLERVEVEALCEKARGNDILKIANLLCPANIVISGSLAACERAAEMAQSFGRHEGHAVGGRRRSSIRRSCGRPTSGAPRPWPTCR